MWTKETKGSIFLKLTLRDPPHQGQSLWINVATIIAVMESSDAKGKFDQVWVGDVSWRVTENVMAEIGKIAKEQ